MKDRDNVLRQLDEVDNMIMILNQAVEKGTPINPNEAKSRFLTIRQKLKFVTDRVTAS
jgi:nicotinamide mononucleotide adenylyltransferase